jgi:Tol biopolymer transport system component
MMTQQRGSDSQTWPSGVPLRIWLSKSKSGYAEWRPENRVLSESKYELGDMKRDLLIACGALLVTLMACFTLNGGVAQASFPGSSGLIAIERTSNRRKSSEIWVLDPQTGAARRLTHGGYDWTPAFSPDGRWIVFSRQFQREFRGLWALRPDGAGLHRLIVDEEMEPQDPAFSADGRWVAFSAVIRGAYSEIERVAVRGKHRRRRVLVSGNLGLWASSPAYSPDGRFLAWVRFWAGRERPSQIYLGRPDGRGGRLLTTGNQPEFSPDSRSIVFSREIDCGNDAVGSEIDTISLETRQVSQLVSACLEHFLSSPTYSPDGGWIGYDIASGTGSSLRYKLGFIPVPGITSPVTPFPGLGTDFMVDADPSWQPIP